MSRSSPERVAATSGLAAGQPDLVIATLNDGKRAEIQALLAPYAVSTTSLSELGPPQAEENEPSYLANAAAKAVAAAAASGIAAIADDSGLEVDALDRQPGLYTARWTEQQGSEALACWMLWDLLQGDGSSAPGPWGAAAFSALAVAWPNGRVLSAEGTLRGTIVWPPRASGRGLYGMFVPEGQALSLAELLGPESAGQARPRAQVSHRSLAFATLLQNGLWDHLTFNRIRDPSGGRPLACAV